MRVTRRFKELIDTALRLEGLVRGAGVHAAGVVIAPQPLTELVPVTRTKDEAIVTSYDMKAVEKMGLLKMDFLGLTTLTVIADCLKLIESRIAASNVDHCPDRSGGCGDVREGVSSRSDERGVSV